MVIIGSIPIVLVGVLGRDLIKGPLRSLWVVAIALIVWGVVMLVAEAVAKQDRHEKDIDLKDALIIGGTQALALIPGVSRSGATISAGLMLGLDRVTAARYGFLLGIPALVGAAVLEVPDAIRTGGVGRCPPWSAPRSASSTPTSPSPGCCGSSPGTPSGCSSGTAGRSAAALIVRTDHRVRHRHGVPA